MNFLYRFRWSRGLRRGSAAARLLGLRVRIMPGAWMYVSCECCVVRRADHSSREVRISNVIQGNSRCLF
jgi:hypothetical protein